MNKKICIYWSRRDFRLRDNKALYYALKSAEEQNAYFLPVFIIEDYMTQGDPKHQFGFPSRFFLSQALPSFAGQFSQFLITQGKGAKFFIELSHAYDLEIYVNEDVHPDFYTQIKKIKDAGVPIKLYKDQLTVSKETKTGTGNYYSIFTPFKKAVWKEFINQTEEKAISFGKVSFFDLKNISHIISFEKNSDTLLQVFKEKESILVSKKQIDLGSLGLPKRDFNLWYSTEKEVLIYFKKYLKNEMSLYKEKRDSLEIDTTSKMSLALCWGLVSARTLKTLIQKNFNDSFENVFSTHSNEGAIHFISELIWREFYKYLLFHNPKLLNTEFQEKFRKIQWLENQQAYTRFIAWIKGETGYPVVDAAMMQLAKTGWMHNRSRMIVASILTKNLGVDWRWGQEYFRAVLIDLDEASNNGGWQWGASVGADPKPIRIFNPYLQAENYDKNKIYQNKWLPTDYFTKNIEPLVPHKEAREDALRRYGLSKDGGVRDY